MPILIISRDGKRIGAYEANDGESVDPWFRRNCGALTSEALSAYTVEAVNDIDCNTVEAFLTAIAERMGLSMSCEFVPLSRSRNAKPGKDGKVWVSLNWRCTIGRTSGDGDSVPVPILTCDYSQGSGHCPADKANFHGDKWAKQKAIEGECETGKVWRYSHMMGGAASQTSRAVPPPSIGAILSSLASDADVLDYASFEQWAESFGYDPDSRSTESTFRECLANTLALRAAIGEAGLQELRTVAPFN